MSEENAKIYIVEGSAATKPTEIVAMNDEMAIEIYRQLYEEGMIEQDDLESARVLETKEMIKN